MSPRKAWLRANALQRLADNPAATAPERANASKRLAEHLQRYADNVQRWQDRLACKPLQPLSWAATTAVGRWRRGDELRPGLWRGVAPDNEQVLVRCGTVRRSHRCHCCTRLIPDRGRAWRAPDYNGNHRSDRICTNCWAPDPNALPQLAAR